MATAEDLFFYICPPTVSTVDGAHQVLTVATGASAANYDWFNILGANAPKGSVFLLLEASTKDVYVRFKQGVPETAAAAGTTAVNGLLVKADQPGRVFYVNPVIHPSGCGPSSNHMRRSLSRTSVTNNYRYDTPFGISVTPATGGTAGGTAVTVSCKGLNPGFAAAFNGSPLTSLVYVNSGTFTAVTPAHTAGLKTLRITNANGLLGDLLNSFTYS